MKKFRMIKKCNKVNECFINNFFKEINISKDKKEQILEKYNNNKDSLYCIELIEVDVKKIKFQNLSEIINYFNGLIKFFIFFLIISFSLSGIFTILLINNFKSFNFDSILINISVMFVSFFFVYLFYINIKDFKNLVNEIKNDNKVYLEEVKNDTIIDV